MTAEHNENDNTYQKDDDSKSLEWRHATKNVLVDVAYQQPVCVCVCVHTIAKPLFSCVWYNSEKFQYIPA